MLFKKILPLSFLFLSLSAVADCQTTNTDPDAVIALNAASAFQDKAGIKSMLFAYCAPVQSNDFNASFSPDIESLNWFLSRGFSLNQEQSQQTQGASDIYWMRLHFNYAPKEQLREIKARLKEVPIAQAQRIQSKYKINLNTLPAPDYASQKNQELTKTIFTSVSTEQIQKRYPNFGNITLLHYSVMLNNPQVVTTLLSRTSLIEKRDNNGLLPFDFLFKKSCNPNREAQKSIAISFLKAPNALSYKNKIRLDPLQMAVIHRETHPHIYEVAKQLFPTDLATAEKSVSSLDKSTALSYIERSISSIDKIMSFSSEKNTSQDDSSCVR